MKSKVRLASIHSELKNEKTWVVWREEQAGSKLTKIPYFVMNDNLIKAKSNDAKTWMSFSKAVKTYKQQNFDGIGFATSNNNDIVGIDIDDCIDKDGKLNDKAKRIVNLLQSYTEISPSGRGLRIFVRGHLPEGRRRRKGFEVYDCNHYLTVTGNQLKDTFNIINKCQDQLNIVYREMFPKNKPNTNSNKHSLPKLFDEDYMRQKNIKNQIKSNSVGDIKKMNKHLREASVRLDKIENKIAKLPSELDSDIFDVSTGDIDEISELIKSSKKNIKLMLRKSRKIDRLLREFCD